jgi:hypothetical protein
MLVAMRFRLWDSTISDTPPDPADPETTVVLRFRLPIAKRTV